MAVRLKRFARSSKKNDGNKILESVFKPPSNVKNANISKGNLKRWPETKTRNSKDLANYS